MTMKLHLNVELTDGAGRQVSFPIFTELGDVVKLIRLWQKQGWISIRMEMLFPK